MSFLDKLKAHNAKKHAQNKEKFRQLGEKFKKKKSSDSDSAENDVHDESEMQAPENSSNPVVKGIQNTTETIKASTQRMKEKNAQRREQTKKLREERPQRIAEGKEKALAEQAKIDRINPRTKNLINYVFLGVSMLVGMITIAYDVWPGSFFSNLHSGQDFWRKDMVIAVETAIVIFLLLFPIHYIILRRLANKQAARDEADADL